MNLMQSEDQRAIVSSVAELLADRMPTSRLRQLDGFGDFFKQVGAQGWFGLGLGEDLGGAGYGLADEALLFVEVGRGLAPGPLLATALAARVAAEGGRPDLVEAIVAGEHLVGHAVPAGDGSYVLVDAAEAQHVLVSDPSSASLVPASVLTDRRPAPPVDDVGTRELAWLGAPEVTVTTGEVHRRGQVLTTAQLVGIAQATRDLSTEFAKVRVQFGKPIGAHQAIKHRCADMAVGADAATQQLLFAALAVQEDRPDAAFQVAAARVVAAHAALWNARETIQVHGGMGFTSECDAHLYLKRVHVLGAAFGGVRGAQHDLLAEPASQ
jgi:alkylation response protein AidB-like acyl-CoA dehydrogenase